MVPPGPTSRTCPSLTLMFALAGVTGPGVRTGGVTGTGRSPLAAAGRAWATATQVELPYASSAVTSNNVAPCTR